MICNKIKGWVHLNHWRKKSKLSQKLSQSSNQEISQVKEKANPKPLILKILKIMW